MPSTELTLTARWIFAVDAPPLEAGTITLDSDRIVAVEPRGTRRPDVDLGNVAILPGFVNAHTHLDLSGARGVCPPEPDFTQWLRKVIAYRRSRTQAEVEADIGVGLAECLRFGTTLIGDIASGGASWAQLREAPCRAIVFHELLGLTAARADESQRIADEWLDRMASGNCVAGLSPHAPYSVRQTLYDGLRLKSAPIATHLAETREELELLRTRTGPFVDFLKEMGVWDATGLSADPLDVMGALPSGVFVHGNYLDAATRFLPSQSLVVCPRTHAAFGHSRHPFPHMQVRVALGTDSLASNPDLDILAEARHLRQHYPEVAPATLLRMLTLNGAEALGFAAITGSLTAGKSADLVVLPLADESGDDPHDLVLRSSQPVARTMFRGQWR